MNIRSLAWISDALAAAGIRAEVRLGDAEPRLWRGATIDSRGECTGRLFFALRGENTDGHGYVRAAYAAGCVAAVIDRADMTKSLESDGVALFVVPNALRALQELARSYRNSVDMRVMAITGSAGKTTTKEYANAIMKTKYRVHTNRGNYNSTIGVPLTLLDAEEDTEYLVCEVGANMPGEIDFLAEMIQPDVGVITNIGDAHVGHFGSRDDIAAAKAELLGHVHDTGHAVLPRDDDYFEFLDERVSGRMVSFGRETNADFVLRDVRRDGLALEFTVNREPFTLRSLGEYNALNACAAAAACDACGVAAVSAAHALPDIIPGPGRGRITVAAGITIIDESYNASPESVGLSLEMLAEVAPGNAIAVLGDMAELGNHSEELHRGVGERIATARIGHVFWKGSQAGAVEDGILAASGGVAFAACKELDELVGAVVEKAKDGDVILVKASRACGLDAFVTEFTKRLGSKGAGA